MLAKLVEDAKKRLMKVEQEKQRELEGMKGLVQYRRGYFSAYTEQMHSYFDFFAHLF